MVGARNGYFGPDDHARIVDEIARSAADMLFVGMPSPFKETWCERHRSALNVPVIIGVGGTFDVLAGYVAARRAGLQSLGLEWSWRTGDGAAQDVEALSHHQLRVHLFGRAGDPRAADGSLTGRRGEARASGAE